MALQRGYLDDSGVLGSWESDNSLRISIIARNKSFRKKVKIYSIHAPRYSDFGDPFFEILPPLEYNSGPNARD